MAASASATVIAASSQPRQAFMARRARRGHAAALPTTGSRLEIFGFQVTQRGGRRQRLAGREFEQFLRADARALPVHVLAQPAHEAAEIAARDLLFHVGHRFAQRFVELRRHDGAERVRGEVAERTHGPVHVLQDAFEIVLRLHAEPLLHAGIPRVAQVAHRSSPDSSWFSSS